MNVVWKTIVNHFITIADHGCTCIDVKIIPLLHTKPKGRSRIRHKTYIYYSFLVSIYRPELIPFESLIHKSNEDNLNMAFTVAKQELGISDLLDAEGNYLSRNAK